MGILTQWFNFKGNYPAGYTCSRILYLFMFFESIIVFFLVLHLRKTLRKDGTLPEWIYPLTLALYATVILFVIQIIIPQSSPLIKWLWHFLILGLIAIILKKREFDSARTIIFAVLPILILSFTQDIVGFLPEKISSTIAGYLEILSPFTFVWLVTIFIIFRRQQKALEKEQKKTQEEEKLNKVIATRKSELEVMVAERTAELTKQKEELQHALDELKSTQAQLIQSEKMASLGELTAGIAHEIQNPLNFVNNFSDVNSELIAELNHEIEKGNFEDAKAIAKDIKENEKKIIFHGKRADAIVKSMLQHSRRRNSGIKESTDINALSDEYLRLSYHGLRAKDKSFNATLKTDFDESIGNVNIIPQDIGRVILNLLTNAFYAVTEKKKLGIEGYEPTVSLITKKMGEKVEIRVADNGNGIPRKVLDKIFQPFFTTKPTGQGTGLGLSLSYDIIKAHGGELNVKTTENQGSTFTIALPSTTK